MKRDRGEVLQDTYIEASNQRLLWSFYLSVSLALVLFLQIETFAACSEKKLASAIENYKLRNARREQRRFMIWLNYLVIR